MTELPWGEMGNTKLSDLFFPAAFAGFLVVALGLLSRLSGWYLLAGCCALLAGFVVTACFAEPLVVREGMGRNQSETDTGVIGNTSVKTPIPTISELTEDRVAASIKKQFDNLPIALVRINTSGLVDQANSPARGFLGINAGESPRFEDLVEGLGQTVDTWLSAARAKPNKPKPEMVQAKRGTRDFVLQVSLMDSPVGPPGTLIATLSDATELKSLEAQFVQSQKMQAIGQLAGGVAHDFNNLLTAISGYCDLLLLRHDQGDPDYGDLVQISQNANRAAALVGQLLAFSRKQNLRPSIRKVNDTLSDLTHLLNRLLGEKVRLQTEFGKHLPCVFVDGRQLEQVIMNLVVNARDAMPDGGEVTIISSLYDCKEDTVFDKATVPVGEYVCIKVTDNGCGIRQDRLSKIFEPFFTSKPVGEGTGLGLSMAYGIIKQTGGFIFASSEFEKGSSFTILLPAQSANAQPRKEIVKVEASRSKRLDGLTVMLVEDETPVRAFASRAMKLHGIEVLEAASAELALNKLIDKTVHVDIIVSDVVMPGMDGPTWVRMALEDRPETKVIFVSGYAEEKVAKDHADIANAAFLPKPFSLLQLIDKVRDLSSS
ncbi:MAG: response regulator [Rhodobacteraceae bacterium]|nr:response regulator [Paracoccaceae bacterium]